MDVQRLAVAAIDGAQPLGRAANPEAVVRRERPADELAEADRAQADIPGAGPSGDGHEDLVRRDLAPSSKVAVTKAPGARRVALATFCASATVMPSASKAALTWSLEGLLAVVPPLGLAQALDGRR